MKIERYETGPRMSKAVIHGDTVYLAGIVADSPKSKSMAEQTRSILSQIDGFLAMAGTNKTKLLSANIWITDMAQFAAVASIGLPHARNCGGMVSPDPTMWCRKPQCRSKRPVKQPARVIIVGAD